MLFANEGQAQNERLHEPVHGLTHRVPGRELDDNPGSGNIPARSTPSSMTARFRNESAHPLGPGEAHPLRRITAKHTPGFNSLFFFHQPPTPDLSSLPRPDALRIIRCGPPVLGSVPV